MRPVLPANCDVLAAITETRLAAVERAGEAYDPFNPEWEAQTEMSFKPRRALTVNLIISNKENLSAGKIAEGMSSLKAQMEALI